MFQTLLLSAADPTGRFDRLSIPQQSLMEMLVQDYKDAEIIQYANGEIADIHDWSILQFDDKDNITSINIDVSNIDFISLFEAVRRSITRSSFICDGSIDFKYLPPTLVDLTIIGMRLFGKLETSGLPQDLQTLDIHSNNLDGQFDVAGLPRKLTSVNISSNKLSGSLCMESLPNALKVFKARKNNFSGKICLNKLPPELEILNLVENSLCGPLELRNVPCTLQEVELQQNNFDCEKIIFDVNHDMKLFKVDDVFIGSIVDADGQCIKQPGFEYKETGGAY